LVRINVFFPDLADLNKTAFSPMLARLKPGDRKELNLEIGWSLALIRGKLWS